MNIIIPNILEFLSEWLPAMHFRILGTIPVAEVKNVGPDLSVLANAMQFMGICSIIAAAIWAIAFIGANRYKRQQRRQDVHGNN